MEPGARQAEAGTEPKPTGARPKREQPDGSEAIPERYRGSAGVCLDCRVVDYGYGVRVLLYATVLVW